MTISNFGGTSVALGLCLAFQLAAAPVSVIYDTDMANDCDDAGGLAVLHALADLGEADILAVVTNRKCPGNASAAAASAINHWYGRPGIPIGTDKDGAKTPKRWWKPSSFTGVLRDEFPHSAKPDDRMPDAIDVYRATLASQPDRSVVICSVGALSNLEDLVNSSPDRHSKLDGLELLKRKVKLTVIMGGGFPRTHTPETNIKLDPTAAVTVVNQWPTDILWSGFEVGSALICGSELTETSDSNPVRRSFELRPFRDGRAIDRGKPAHDQAAALLAVRGPQTELWSVVGNGRVISDSEGNTAWLRDWPKRHRYVRIKSHRDTIARVIEDLMKATPKRANAN